MVERPTSSDRIQKITSRIVFIGLAAATMIITVSIVGAIQLQQASAAPPNWCLDYTISGTTYTNCSYTSKQACEESRSQTAPEYNPSRCYKEGSSPKPSSNWCLDYTISGTTYTNCSYTSKQACEESRSQTAPEYNPSRCYRQ
jgi:hypothetical protein